MKLLIDLDGRELPMEVSRAGEACHFRLGDAPARQALVREAEPCVYSVLLDGRSYDAHVEQTGECVVVVIAGERFEIGVRDPRRWSRKSAGPSAEGRQRVTAPMPGKVVRVLVKTGDSVTAGQGLLVVEAMKMQNEMKAGKSGRVVSLPVAEGSTVSAGEILATIE